MLIVMFSFSIVLEEYVHSSLQAAHGGLQVCLCVAGLKPGCVTQVVQVIFGTGQPGNIKYA